MKKLLIPVFTLTLMLNGATAVNAQSPSNDIEIQTYNESINGTDYEITTYDSKDLFKVNYEDENGESHTGELNKETKVLTVDGDVIEYSFSDGIPATSDRSMIQTRASSDWTPVLVAKGLKINCSPIFKSAGYVATAIITVAGTSVGSKLGSATVAAVVSSALGQAVGDAVSKINVTFKYDLYRTKNPVYVGANATVKTTGYRYQNYSMSATYKGKKFSKNTTKCGSWWSSSKPF